MTVHNDTVELLFNSTDAAHFLKINPKTLQSIASSGRVPAIWIGKPWHSHKAHLENWLKSQSRRSQ